MSVVLDSKIPSGPLEKKWESHKFNSKLINPANRRKYEIIVVGSGLAGASAAASLGELGYSVKCFCYQDSARRPFCPRVRRAARESLLRRRASVAHLLRPRPDWATVAPRRLLGA